MPTAKVDAEFVVLETSGPVAAGNLLDDDVQGADGATVTHISFDGVTYQAITGGTPNAGGFAFSHPGGNGTIVIHADGTWTFDPTFNAAATSQQADFWYSITDSDGDVSSAKQDVLVTNANLPLTVSGSVAGLVEEEHLVPGTQEGFPVTAQGIEDIDDAGGLDTDTAGNFNNVRNVHDGVISAGLVFTGNEGALTYEFYNVADSVAVAKTAGGNLTSDGSTVFYHWVNATTLVGYADVGAAGNGYQGSDREVFKVEITNTTTGAYKFTLLDRVDHPTNSTTEEAIAINLGGRVKVSDGGDTNDDEPLANFAVTVIDDVPVTANESGAGAGRHHGAG